MINFWLFYTSHTNFYTNYLNTPIKWIKSQCIKHYLQINIQFRFKYTTRTLNALSVLFQVGAHDANSILNSLYILNSSIFTFIQFLSGLNWTGVGFCGKSAWDHTTSEASVMILKLFPNLPFYHAVFEVSFSPTSSDPTMDQLTFSISRICSVMHRVCLYRHICKHIYVSTTNKKSAVGIWFFNIPTHIVQYVDSLFSF